MYCSPSYIFFLSLHDALPIFCFFYLLMSFDYICSYLVFNVQVLHIEALTPSKLNSQLLNVYCLKRQHSRSEEHTSELQSRGHLVCRLLLEKKKTSIRQTCTL